MNRSLLSSIAILAALSTASSSSLAADFGMDDPMVVAATGDFEGAYVGVFGTTYLGVSQYGVGIELGYNFLPSEAFLLGLEVSGVMYPTGYDPEVWLKGKAGFAADTFAVYGFGEVGAYFAGGTATQQYGVGAGAEMFVSDSLSVALEAGMRADIGNSLANPHAQVGLRFHL
jgi:hypothetical protein